MFIKEIIVDGFKSYANRTVVPDFDPQFNAITGLNGSGKSNILDSICFVLGITQLSQVRVANLQGLVYKQGQSGVTKASVSIVFNNSDRERAPVGYENDNEITVTRQVVIGGRNKYLINGRSVQAKEVQNLFHSVQLNVNNPHFLIMQGRITKVLNMKPPEILGMIEEAVGTRMYESKKADAQRKMEQKQTKVDEIETLLAEEITPKLDKLRNEKQSYLKWASQNTEIERLQRFCVAHRYYECVKLVTDADAHESTLASQIQALETEMNDMRATLEDMRESEAAIGGEAVKKLEKRVEKLAAREDEASKVLVKGTSRFENVKAKQAKLQAKQQSMIDQQAAFADLRVAARTRIDQAKSALEAEAANYAAAKRTLSNAQLALQAANAGLDNSAADGEDGDAQQLTMEEKLVGLRSAAEAAATEVTQQKMKLDHAKKDLKAVAAQVKKAKSANTKSQNELEKYTRAVAALEAEVSAIDYNPEAAADLEAGLEAKASELVEAKDKAEQLAAQLTAFDFEYADPSADFDRSKVKGTVASLIDVPNKSHAPALEVVAGGKLFQVVVDAVDTGKALLDKGKLKRRVTIIPLDKVASKPIAESKLQAAGEIAAERNGTAQSALSLVGFDDEVARAMEYVFGTTLVCDSLTTARSVTFDKRVSVKSVTLDGDAFDPQGTLSGGSRSTRGSALAQLQRLREFRAQVASAEKEIADGKRKLAGWTASAKAYAKASSKLDLARHELGLVKERIGSTPFAQLLQKQEGLETTLSTLTEGIAAAGERREKALADAAAMEEEMKDMEAARSNLITKAQNALQQAKDQFSAAEGQYQKAQGAADSAELALEDLDKEEASMEESLLASQTQTSDGQEELDALEADVNQLKEAHQEALAALEACRAELDACRAELGKIAKSRAKIEDRMQACELKTKELESDKKRIDVNSRDAAREGKQLRANNPWIASEEQFFGKPHTDYDFAARNPSQAKKRLAELDAAQNKMSRNVNKKVMGMIDKAEQEYEDLNRKRTIIEKDRKTIERVIKDLDTKAEQALQTSWEKVNADFGSIFSTLLPGTQAKLEPPEGGTIRDGLEVRVAFGETWKKSLTELSGGQRSLLALSLILALLLFKPAPMYILDEVDAALDLSHTQNIGQMLRTHFAHSQFIVVSLKEGMFNNANVIFRTKFVDGVSTVTRTSNKDHIKRLKYEEKTAAANKRADKLEKSKKRSRADQNIAVNQ
ncbi:Structural maintenance of chromosomes protein 2-2 [Hondaea fermentalgiana]|uniref:Structural maintenance of chromosomes protein n=1 Tax=Hondaea fermentalgiana TaxID=2315210 RepID=A0A2R5GXH4_9STRA|nr:Structural maintenance of chromosomes protein 2-2 [Hondaea fermentalgiana]|eukprot:GBG33111.1 Structural maintenance of chromosomes protein 2-2 [Hondaea fermentalgiana]